MEFEYDDSARKEADTYTPQAHPYLHEPLLYISNLPPFVTDQNLATAFVSCGPFRPTIPRDGTNMPLSGTIEFRNLEKGIIHFRKLLKYSATSDLTPFSRKGPRHPPLPASARPAALRPACPLALPAHDTPDAAPAPIRHSTPRQAPTTSVH